MREIKFRAWYPGSGNPYKFFMTYWKLGSGLDNSYFFRTAKDVMQFTGLKDKNGKEIYEGDIIESQRIGGLIKYAIEWDEKNACFKAGGVSHLSGYWGDADIVIGNIYENPQLLI